GAKSIRATTSKKDRVPIFNDRSRLDLFVGRILPPIYRKHFKDEPGISRNGRRHPAGPYLRFCEQVLKEFGWLSPKGDGKPYSRLAIEKAWRNERLGIIRRKSQR